MKSSADMYAKVTRLNGSAGDQASNITLLPNTRPPRAAKAATAAETGNDAETGTDEGLQAKVADAIAQGHKQRRGDAREHAANTTQEVKAALEGAGHVAIDQYGTARFLTMRGARYAALRLESQDCRDHLQCIATEAGKSLGKDKLSEFCEALRGRAKRDNAKIVVHTRVAADTTNPSEHVYFLNLANDAGEIVRITPHGWYVEHNTTIAFLPDLGALPTPIQPENHKEAYEIVSHFLVEQGVAPDTVMLVIAALLEWLRPGTAYPILDILGPAGGGKTALASSIVALIDPTKSGKLTDASLEEEQLAALAQSAHILAVDNSGRLDAATQNMLCKVCYGMERASRKFYTQTEVERQPVYNPIVITSIAPAITAPDLQARSIRVMLKPRYTYISQLELSKKRDGARAEVLGALLTLFSSALAHLNTSTPYSHRLVDFVQMGEGLAVAMGEADGTFVQLYDTLQEKTSRDVASGDDFIRALCGVLTAVAKTATAGTKLPPLQKWTHEKHAVQLPTGQFVAGFTSRALLDALREHATKKNEKSSDNVVLAIPSRLPS